MSRIEANPTPWKIEPHQGQHGDWTAIVAPFGHIVATIPSPCWDADAKLRYPRDYENARLIVCAVNAHDALIKALEACLSAARGEYMRCMNTAGGLSEHAFKRYINDPTFKRIEAVVVNAEAALAIARETA